MSFLKLLSAFLSRKEGEDLCREKKNWTKMRKLENCPISYVGNLQWDWIKITSTIYNYYNKLTTAKIFS